MTVQKSTVLLLKSQKTGDTTDKYEVMLQEAGYKTCQVKTLDFKFINLELLYKELKNPEDYSGIILSSPRCVNACYLALNGETIDPKWKTKRSFVVGETTFETALEKLGLKCEGSGTGNAENLATKIIAERDEFLKPFLFPHGNLKTDTLKKHFLEVQLALGEVHVYDTIANPDLRQELADVTQSFTAIPEYVVFFSPSGVESSIDFLRLVESDLSSVKFIAIGPVTEKRLIEKGVAVYSVAVQPTPEEVLKAIKA